MTGPDGPVRLNAREVAPGISAALAHFDGQGCPADMKMLQPTSLACAWPPASAPSHLASVQQLSEDNPEGHLPSSTILKCSGPCNLPPEMIRPHHLNLGLEKGLKVQSALRQRLVGHS